MHGFNWVMDVFIFLVLYWYSIPLTLLWIAMFLWMPKTVRGPWLIIGAVLHVMSIAWVIAIEQPWYYATGLIVAAVAYFYTVSFRKRMIHAQGDLYAQDIKVVQPNELKK